jgi:dihydrofolate reductase
MPERAAAQCPFRHLLNCIPMIISFVVAAAENNAIGRNNQLPWRLPEDLRFFKRTTLGKPVIMGRKTWESLGGKPLPNRQNIVLSSKPPELPEGVLHSASLEDALNITKASGAEETCIIGGGQIFEAALPLADVIYLTRVHTVIEDGDAFFPVLSADVWKLAWEEAHQADEKNNFDFTFQRWERINK